MLEFDRDPAQAGLKVERMVVQFSMGILQTYSGMGSG